MDVSTAVGSTLSLASIFLKVIDRLGNRAYPINRLGCMRAALLVAKSKLLPTTTRLTLNPPLGSRLIDRRRPTSRKQDVCPILSNP